MRESSNAAYQGLVGRVSTTDATVLIQESRVQVKRLSLSLFMIYQIGIRPLHSINCGAIPGELLESELFHERILYWCCGRT